MSYRTRSFVQIRADGSLSKTLSASGARHLRNRLDMPTRRAKHRDWLKHAVQTGLCLLAGLAVVATVAAAGTLLAWW